MRVCRSFVEWMSVDRQSDRGIINPTSKASSSRWIQERKGELSTCATRVRKHTNARAIATDGEKVKRREGKLSVAAKSRFSQSSSSLSVAGRAPAFLFPRLLTS